MSTIKLKEYKQNLLNNGECRDVILDQYGREFKWNGETKEHEPTGICGHADH